jgi:hypothetical protein
VSTSALETDELDNRERRAWADYSERLRDLTGDEYDAAESESWDQLQGELRTLERKRRSPAQAPS